MVQALVRELEAVAVQLVGDSTAGDAAAPDASARNKEYGVTFHTVRSPFSSLWLLLSKMTPSLNLGWQPWKG